MRHANIALVPVVAIAAALGRPAPVSGQTPAVVAHTVDVSSARSSLELQLSNDDVVNVTLERGEIRINGSPAGTYPVGGRLETTWRAFLDSAAALSTGAVVAAVRRWPRAGGENPEAAAQQAIATALNTLAAIPVAQLPAPPEPPSEPFEQVVGDFDHDPDPDPGIGFAGVGPTLAGLLGAFVALASIAFGLVSFAPRQLDVVSGTVQQSFARSFFAGLFAQPLLLPALGVLVVALVLTVVGILVVPVAIVAFALAVAVGVVGGYIASARAMGERYLRRKMARGAVVSADPTFRAVVVGLAGLLMIWLPFALFGWVPGFGEALLVAAILFTWVMATAGLGATILSRAGLKGPLARRGSAELSGELSWSTLDEIAPSKRAGEGSVP
jgi:hypothetical protein